MELQEQDKESVEEEDMEDISVCLDKSIKIIRFTKCNNKLCIITTFGQP